MATFGIRPDSVEKKVRKVIAMAEASARIHPDKKPMKRTNRVALKQFNENDAKRVKLSNVVHTKQNLCINKPCKTIVRCETDYVEEEDEEEDQRNELFESLESDLKKLRSECEREAKETEIALCRKGNFVPDIEYHFEYLNDIWLYLINMENTVKWPKPNYMVKQQHLNSTMRSVLVDWLVAVSEEYKMSDQTLHLTINYIDRFLSHMLVVKDKFQLLGSAAMMLAGKIEDVYPPDAKEWAYLSGNSYSSQQVLKMEQLILKVLNFDLQPPTALAFIQHLCVTHKLDKETMYLAMYFSELVLLEGEDYLQYLPSKLASASIALARFTLSKRNPWPRKLEASSGYTLKQLSPVVHKQNRTFNQSPIKPQQAIQTKYQTDVYHRVALLKPKILNLDETED